MKMRGKLLGAAITAAAVNTAVTCELSAQSERDVAFSAELNKMQMYDYSEMHLKEAIEKKPEDVDRLKFQLAETYIMMNKQPDAVKIIASIPDSSPYSVPGHAQVGTSLLKKGNYNDAITSLEKVLAFYKANKEKPDSVAPYAEALQYLLVGYRETKQTPKMKELQDLLTADMDPRAARYTKCMIDLDAAETLKANPKKEEPPAPTAPAKPMTDAEKKAAADKEAAAKKLVDGVAKAFDNRATVNKKSPEYLELLKVNRNDWVSLTRNVVLSLQDNMWSMDNVAALSTVATARALVLLEKYDEALKELNTFKELFDACDASFKDQKIPLGESPGAGALYWQGVIYYTKYTNAKTPEDGIKDLRRAFISYGKLLKNYPGFQPNLANKAYAQFLKICDELSEKDPSIAAKVAEEKAKVPAPESAGDAAEGAIENIMPGEAEQLFNNKRFADVIKILTPIVIEKRNHPGLPPLIQALSCSLAQTGDEITAMALADYLAMRFPKSEYTALTLAQTAQIIWTKSKDRRDDAIYLYSLLLKVAPASQWSCDAATMIGQEYFNRAVALALEANKLSGDAKKDKRDEAFSMFRKSIEAFDVIIEKYANNKERVQLAYLKTASAYVSLEDYEKAAETYKLYCQSEPENLVNLASAKINITDNLFRAAQEYEKKARDIREAAAAMDDETAPAESADGKTETKAEAKPEDKQPAKTEVKQEPKTEEKSGDNQADQDAATAVVLTDANSKAGKLAEAKTLDGIAQTMYAEAIQNVNEFLTAWIAKGGVLASVATNPAVVKNIETGYSLRPWLYDASGKKAEAAKDFNDFIKAYPDNKAIPKCMMRLGVIYTELGDDNKASEVLSKLSTDPKFKDTPEGRNAKFYLAKTLYSNQSFDKCIAIFTEIFNSKELLSNLTVQNLRWIASNLTNCGGQHPKNAAQIAYRASKDLLSRLEKPDMKEWVGSQRAAELSAPNKKAEFASVMNTLKEKLLFDAGTAAYWSEDYKNALDSFNAILENKNTAYFYDVNFARADVYIKMKKYDSAREDYTAVASTATMAKQYSTYNKAQCLIGDTHIEEKNMLKAMAAFNIIAAPAFAQDDTFAMKFPNEEAKAKYEKEMEASREWLEYAIYRAAYCASILGRNEDKAKMIEKYKKNFPEGRFIKDLTKLPPADPQYQQTATP